MSHFLNTKIINFIAGTALVLSGVYFVAHAQGGSLFWITEEVYTGRFNIASSADGTKLISSTLGGWSGDVWTSTDSGASWIARTVNPDFTTLREDAVASSADGTKLVVVGVDIAYTSTNSGATWTAHDVPGSGQLLHVTSSSDGIKLAAVGNNGPGGHPTVYTSSNSGVTWVQRTVGPDFDARGLASSADGTKLVTFTPNSYGAGTGQNIYTSSDSGATWIERTGAGRHQWHAVASSADGTKLVAASIWNGASNEGYIYTSTDSGVTWTQRSGAGQHDWSAIASSADGTKLIASHNHDNADNPGGYVYVSTDSGVTWTKQTDAGTDNSWYSVASSADGTKLYALGLNTFARTTTPPAFDYTLASNSSNITIMQGGSGSFVLTKTLVSGTTQPVTLSVSGLPAGLTINPAITNNPSSPTGVSILSLEASASVTPGVYPLTVTGTSANTLNQTVIINVTVITVPVPQGFNAQIGICSQKTWMWSDNIGWVDFSPPAGYGGVVLQGNNTFSGYAWSDSIGWVKFGGLSGFPSGVGTRGVNAQVNSLNQLEGWVRACGGMGDVSSAQTTPNNSCTGVSRSDGWDGWISLKGVASDNSTYGSIYRGNRINGYAWGGEVVGWLTFNPVISASINLAWARVDIAEGYYVYRNDGTTVSKMRVLQPASGTTVSFEDIALDLGGLYSYIVTSIVSGVEGAPSSTIYAIAADNCVSVERVNTELNFLNGTRTRLDGGTYYTSNPYIFSNVSPTEHTIDATLLSGYGVSAAGVCTHAEDASCAPVFNRPVATGSDGEGSYVRVSAIMPTSGNITKVAFRYGTPPIAEVNSSLVTQCTQGSSGTAEAMVVWLPPPPPYNNDVLRYDLEVRRDSDDFIVSVAGGLSTTTTFKIVKNLLPDTSYTATLTTYYAGYSAEDSSQFKTPPCGEPVTELSCTFEPPNSNIFPYPVLGNPVTLKLVISPEIVVPPYTIVWTGADGLSYTQSNVTPQYDETSGEYYVAITRVYSILGKKWFQVEVTDSSIPLPLTRTCNIDSDTGPYIRIRPVFDEY